MFRNHRRSLLSSDFFPRTSWKVESSKQGPSLTAAQGLWAGTEGGRGRSGSTHAALLPPHWVLSQPHRQLSQEACTESSCAAMRQLWREFAGKVNTLPLGVPLATRMPVQPHHCKPSSPWCSVQQLVMLQTRLRGTNQGYHD